MRKVIYLAKAQYFELITEGKTKHFADIVGNIAYEIEYNGEIFNTQNMMNVRGWSWKQKCDRQEHFYANASDSVWLVVTKKNWTNKDFDDANKLRREVINV